MERGANPFPFHNCLPYSESNEGIFLFFSPSLNWIKEKSVATLAIRNICDKTQNKQVSYPTVSHRHSVFGELDLPIKIGPQLFITMFLSWTSILPTVAFWAVHGFTKLGRLHLLFTRS